MHRPTLRSSLLQIAVALVAAVCLGLAVPAAWTRLGAPAPQGTATAPPTAAPGTPGPLASGSSEPGASAGGSAAPVPSAGPSSPPIPSGDSVGIPGPQVVSGVAIPVLSHGPRTRRVVALTFDDGWGVAATKQVFAVLLAEHVRATFFPYAAAARNDPAVWRAIAAAGYPIGDHTTNHPDLTTLVAWRVQAELTVARTTMARITGVPILDVFRPPYGAWNGSVLADAAAVGFRGAIMWDVDTRDWTGIPAWQIAARAEAGRNGSIILMHAGPAQTPLALPAIIAWYRARGYTFVTIPELLAGELAPAATASPTTAPTPSPAPTAPSPAVGSPAPTSSPAG